MISEADHREVDHEKSERIADAVPIRYAKPSNLCVLLHVVRPSPSIRLFNS